MATNHYKGQSNRFSEDDLPEEVQNELSATFSPDVIYALLRDAYYRGPVAVGAGGERRVYGGGKPGTGLRRPDGPLYDYPESWRTSVLRKATDLDLLYQVGEGPLDEGTFAATFMGMDLLLTRDRCEECGRVNRPTLKDSGSERRLTKVRTACPVHEGAGDYERDLDEVPEVPEGAFVYLNDDAELRERDPDGLRDELDYGDRVEVSTDDRSDRREGVVVENLSRDALPESHAKAMGPVNSFYAEEGVVVLWVDEDGELTSGGRTFDRTALRLVEESYVTEVPVFSEGAKVRTHGGDVSREVVEVLDEDYYRVRYPSSNSYSEGEQSTAVYHGLELRTATRRLDLPEPEFDEGDEVRHLPARDRDEDFKLGTPAEVARVVEEDYDDERGYYYVLNYAGTDDYYMGVYGRDLLDEADARERDPDGTPFEEGDLVRVEDSEETWKVWDDPTPSVERNTYSYRLVPESKPSQSEATRRTGVIRNDRYANHGDLSPVEE